MNYDQEENIKTSAGIEDLLNEEEEVFESGGGPVKLATGVAGNVRPERPKAEGVNPNAKRWMFNPFEVIDLTNEGASCGMDYLRNVAFNCVKSIPTNVAKTDTYELPKTPHNSENYDTFQRTALMIALELENKHGDKGVVTLPKLEGQNEDVAAGLNVLLFGEEVACSEDINFPDHPCPILPTLLEVLDENLRTNVPGLDAETKTSVMETATIVRRSIGLAMRNARTRIDEAQKRLRDEKNPNRTLSYAEQRCYLALGQEIPNQMPFLTRSAAMGLNSGQGSNAGLADAVAAGVVAGMAALNNQQGAPTAPLPQNGGSKPADFSVGDGDIITAQCPATTASGGQCKNTVTEDGEFCRIHAAKQAVETV